MKIVIRFASIVSLVVIQAMFSGCEEDDEPKLPLFINVDPLNGITGEEVIISTNDLSKLITIDIYFGNIKIKDYEINDDLNQIKVKVPPLATTGTLSMKGQMFHEGLIDFEAKGPVFEVPRLGGVDWDFKNEVGLIAHQIKLISNKIYLSGSSWETSFPFLVKLNEDGSVDETFDLERPDFENYAHDFGVAENGSAVFVGNLFYSYGPSSIKRFLDGIARVHPDGKFDYSMPRGFGPIDTGQMLSVGVQKDDKIVIGGNFNQYYFLPADDYTTLKAPRKGIMRLNSDFSLDESFNPGEGIDGAVRIIKILDNNKIMIAGTFGSYDGQVAGNIALINSDGSLNNDFKVGQGFNGRVYCVEQQSDGKWVVGGEFTEYNGQLVTGIARLNVDGSLDNSFEVNLQNEYGELLVNRLTIDSGGRIALAGAFNRCQGRERLGIAIVNNEGDLDQFDIGNTYFTPEKLQNSYHDNTLVLFDNNDDLVISGSIIYNTEEGVHGRDLTKFFTK